MELADAAKAEHAYLLETNSNLMSRLRDAQATIQVPAPAAVGPQLRRWSLPMPVPPWRWEHLQHPHRCTRGLRERSHHACHAR